MQLSPQFLEAMNGMRLILCASLIFLFGRYIWIEFARQMEKAEWASVRAMFFPAGFQDAVTCTWHSRRAAIAMFVLLSGEGTIALAVWSWRHFELSQQNQFVILGATAGIMLFIMGSSCAIRAFAPERWHRWRPWYAIPFCGLIVSVALAI
jgi:hypothetical protein